MASYAAHPGDGAPAIRGSRWRGVGGLQVVRRWEAGPWISTPEPLERIRTAWRAAGPLMAWLDTNVGAAEADRPSAARELSTAAARG